MALKSRIKHISDISNFLQAGRAVCTLVNTEKGTRQTFRFRRARKDEPGTIFVHSRRNDEGHWTYVGVVFQRRGVLDYHHGRKSRLAADSTETRTAKWLVEHASRKVPLPDVVEFWHEGTCGRCGRKLTVPESIKTGFGPECVKHVQSWRSRNAA